MNSHRFGRESSNRRSMSQGHSGDFVTRHPLMVVALVVIFITCVGLISYHYRPSKQERIERQTDYITKTMPDGTTVDCFTYHDSITCNWPK